MSETKPRKGRGKRNRRTFLKGMAAGGAAAAVATAAGGANAATETQAAPGGAKGYRLTQHIRDYYKTAAF